MASLLLLVGILALLSGVLQVFGRGRDPGSLPLQALLEIPAGLATAFWAVMRPPSPLLGGAVFVVLGTTVLSGMFRRARRARTRRRHRVRTEAARLETYVRYLSERPDGQADPEARRPS